MIKFRHFVKMSEEMNATDGAVRGLGFVTGDPGGSVLAWAALNSSDADTRDQILNNIKKVIHDQYHKDIETDRDTRIKRIVDIIKKRN